MIGVILMKSMKSRKIFQIVVGILLLLASVAMLISNLLLADVVWDVAYGMLMLLVFLLGLIMTVFGAASLPQK